MASVVLKSFGSAAGNFLLPGLGGMILGGFGASLGGIIDSQLGLTGRVTGPHLDNLSVQDSRYGAGIPVVYGNARVAGNVIWSTDLIQTQHNSNAGGKGGGSTVSQTTYTYSVHCAVAICAGQIAGINTIWADSTVIYQNGVWISGANNRLGGPVNTGFFDGVSIYTGAPGQAPDGFMQSILGAGNVPAYQNLAYIVFDNLQLASFGNRLPNLTFEIASAVATTNPVMLGSVDAAVSQRIAGVQGGSMLPIVLQGNGLSVQTVLVGGYVGSGSTASFTIATYDVTENTPVQTARVSSASFSASAPTDCAWTVSPDGRFVALYFQNSTAPTHSFVLYDTQAQSFGSLYTTNLATSSAVKQIAWLDAQHFVIDDSVGGVRGLRTLARAGNSLLDLGFTGVWGSGSTASTALFYGAQFTPYADGLLAYVNTTPGTSSLTLQARVLSWRGNALAVGAAFTVAGGLALGTGSGPSACFVQTASAEWTLFFSTVLLYGMISFDPSNSGATITRPWQTILPGFGTGTTNFPVFYGDRLLILQRAASANTYSVSEVTLGSSSFTLSVNVVAVSGMASEVYFNGIRLDSGRILLMGMGGFSYDIGQLCIIERNANGSVATILSDILSRAGYATGDYDVSALTHTPIQGYVLQDVMSARNAIEPLQAYIPFDLIETAGQLKAVLRGNSPVATVPASEWRAADEGKAPPPPLLITRAQEMDLPREVDVDVIDPARNFEVNSQRARRIATSARTIQKLSLPIVCDAGTAKQIAETRLYTAWAERDLIKLSVSRAWLALDPGDVISLGNGSLLRIASITQSGGLIQIEGFYSYAATLSSTAAADGGQSIASNNNPTMSSVLYLMDVPLLQASDDQPGVYVAATGLAGWKGASILRSSDGATYTSIGALALPAMGGIATSVLATGSSFYMDNANTVNVQVTQGSLSSCSWIDLTNGANVALLGGEIIQFQTATLIGSGLYTLRNLLRGRRGTESAIATHVLGENFVLLQAGAVEFLPDQLSTRNKTYDFRALTAGQTLGNAQDYVFTYGMKTLCPFAPATLQGTRSNGTTGDLTISWKRRARLNAEWVDYIDVPLDEPQELYEVDIMNGATLVRTFTGLTSPSVIYSAGLQTADWGGSIPSSFAVTIYQVSARYGNGNAATVVL